MSGSIIVISVYIEQSYPRKNMKSWCLKDHNTGHVFKILLTEEELQEYLKCNPSIDRCIDCVECDDASSITLE